jgi:preprotein translocase subunit SecF
VSKFSGLGGRLYRGETSINFIGQRRRWYALSGFFVLLSIGALAIQGLTLGIEFKGGSSFTVNTPNPSVAQAREAAAEAGLQGEPIVQLVGNDKVRVQTPALEPALNNAIQDALAAKFSVSASSIDVQIIGPSWGKEITRKALYGLFGFLLVVMIYLAMALEPKMAIAAIFAVVHDVFITVGIYALVGFDVTPATIIGFLTILGYSLYDTVVVFDRVRDNTKSISAVSTRTYSQAVNLAVNQTIVRSANTSIVAILPVAAILFVGAGLLGAGTLKDLSLSLFIGLLVGTYSSLFIAPAILTELREKEPAMQALAKRVEARGGASTTTTTASTGSSVAVAERRGPRNQPKRKGRK